MKDAPDLGVGIGLRIPHYRELFARTPAIDWLEIISENFLTLGGKPRHNLDRALASYRLVQHGVSLSIGSTDPLDWDYLASLKRLVRHTSTPWLSDHLCFGGANDLHLHELFPLPYAEDVAAYVAERARIVQDYLEVPFALENVSSYMTYRDSTMTEWDFLSAVAERADIGILLDVNNVYVSSRNHGFDPHAYIEGIPADRVVQMHLAGHTDHGRYILDTHSGAVIDEVYELMAAALRRTGPVSILIEWDEDIPPLDRLLAEADKARSIRDAALKPPSAQAAIHDR